MTLGLGNSYLDLSILIIGPWIIPLGTNLKGAIVACKARVTLAAIDAVAIPRQRVIRVSPVGVVGSIAIIICHESQLRH